MISAGAVSSPAPTPCAETQFSALHDHVVAASRGSERFAAFERLCLGNSVAAAHQHDSAHRGRRDLIVAAIHADLGTASGERDFVVAATDRLGPAFTGHRLLEVVARHHLSQTGHGHGGSLSERRAGREGKEDGWKQSQYL